ncbi:hypothetical protein ACFL6S_19045 [Candidatus Poribacteria bacterium]
MRNSPTNNGHSYWAADEVIRIQKLKQQTMERLSEVNLDRECLLSDDFVGKACDVVRDGLGVPQWFSDDVLVPGLTLLRDFGRQLSASANIMITPLNPEEPDFLGKGISDEALQLILDVCMWRRYIRGIRIWEN